MRIGELAKRAAVSRDTIRFYERRGLIHSGLEGDNGYRVYPEEALLTLEVVRDAQAAGLSIADITLFISQFLSELAGGEEADGFLAAKIAEIEKRQEASARFLTMLRDTQAALARAPQDGLDEIKAGAGNGNRTRN